MTKIADTTERLTGLDLLHAIAIDMEVPPYLLVPPFTMQ
jgi:hypothetical protein